MGTTKRQEARTCLSAADGWRQRAPIAMSLLIVLAHKAGGEDLSAANGWHQRVPVADFDMAKVASHHAS
eukprot:396485-Pelagomonas_calceolata.AAC.1